jgi:uncharacterized protein YjiK
MIMFTLDKSRLKYLWEFIARAFLFITVVVSSGFAEEPYTRLVQKIEPSEFGGANPAGIAFVRSEGSYLIAPRISTNEVVVLSQWDQTLRSVTLPTAIPDPFNMTFDDKRNSLLFFDENADQLVEITMRIDGERGLSGAAVTHHDLNLFNSKNLLGMTSDSETGDLFFLVVPGSPESARIIHLIPDSRGGFDGPAALRDGRVNEAVLKSLPTSLRGIAFNPEDGHLYVMSPNEERLYEINKQGETVSTRDISAYRLRDVQNMIFAPSGDQTDEPSTQSLFITDRGERTGEGGIVELTFIQPVERGFSPMAIQFTLVKNTHTWQWDPPSPDASGICYIPSSNHLLVCDGEVEENTWNPPIWGGANVWEIALSGNQVREFNTLAFSEEPTDVAYNPNNQHLYFSDDTGTKSVYDLDAGSDGVYGTSDDIFTSVNTGNYGTSDPEGVTYDTEQGHVFWVDGVNREVYELALGANGVLGGGDDVLIQHFDTNSLGASDPEGVEFNPDNGHLYILGSNDIIIETTRDGNYIQEASISSLNPRKPAGLAYAPTSNNSFSKSLYIVCRGTDNDGHPTENDGELYEISLGSVTPVLSINDVALLEGDNGTVDAIFTVTLSSATSDIVTVNYATSDGSATTGDNDYVSTSGQVSFSPGQTNRPVTVMVNGDGTDEPDETFFVNLSNAVNAPISDDQGAGTILNDDGPQLITLSFQDGTSGYSGTRDTWIESGAPTANHGTDATLYIDGSPDLSSLVYWDLTIIPPGSIVQSVDIQTNVQDASSTAYELYELKRPWVESEATWNQFAPGQNWQTAGAQGSQDKGSTVLGAISGSSTGSNTTSLNSAGIALVQSWIDDPNSNHGLIIQNYNNSNGLDLSSSEAATVLQRPKLTVRYQDTGVPPSVPWLSINDISVTEGTGTTSNANFTVTLSSASAETVTVDYATADGTAKSPGDYNAIPVTTLIFLPGTTTQTITAVINGDLLDEVDESFVVNLSNPGNATISDNQGQGTIIDDDAAPSLTIGDVTADEGAGTMSFTVSLSAMSGRDVSVDYATADGSASALDDYTAVSSTLAIPASSASGTISVAVNGDVLDEADETFLVNLSNPVNATISDNQGVGTITDDDPAPSLSIDDVTADEGSGAINFTVSLSAISGQDLSVDYATADGSATAPDDYTTTLSTLTVPAGSASGTVSVAIIDDAIPESAETFTLNLSNAVNATISDNQGVGTITDNEGLSSLAINDVSVNEGNSGTVDAVFTVTLSPANSQTVTVDYATADDNAVAPGDYVAAGPLTVTFPPNTTTQTISVTVNGDVLDEADETFLVNLSNPVNATISDNQGVGTITDDDPTPSLSIDDVTADEGSGAISFTVSLSAISGRDVNVDYATANGSAIASDDYVATSGTLTIPQGSASETITVNLIDDVFAEPTETFFVNLSNATNATIADNQGQASITDVNDVLVSVIYNETQTGQASNSGTVATSSDLTAANGDFYIAAIAGSGSISVNSVAGLGLSWTILSAQCATGNSVGLEVWAGEGVPTQNGAVTATFSGSPDNSVIAVSRYSNVDLSNAVSGVLSGNPAGLNGSCSSNSKSSSYSFDLSTTVDGAIVFGAATATKNGLHNPGVNFTERAEVSQGRGKSETSVAVQDKMVTLASLTTVDGSFDKTVEWAIIGLAINPASATLMAGGEPTPPAMSKTHSDGSKDKIRKENEMEVSTTEATTSPSQPIPQEIALMSNYPNPFNPETTVAYAIPTDTRVRIVIYNSMGQQVRLLVDEFQEAGNKTVGWNGKDDRANSVGSGIYFVQLVVDKTSLIRKMVLLK